jgi:hypothetical protein
MKNLLTLLSMLLIGSLSAQEIDIKSDLPSEDIVYVFSIDDEKIEVPNTDGVLNDLKPEWINNINVIKGNSIPTHIKTTYKDVRGVINIDLKSVKEAKAFFEELQTKLEVVVIKENDQPVLSVKKVDASRDVKIRMNRNEEVDILLRIHIKGKVFTLDQEQQFLSEVDPEDIDAIRVLKDNASLVKYEAEDKDGVIEIMLKTNKRTEKLYKKLEKQQKKNKDQN